MVHSDNQHCIAFWNNVAIVDVAGDLDAGRMRGVGRAYATLAESYRRGIASVVLLRPSAPVASAEARGESTKFMRELGPLMLHTAMVIEHPGVIAQLLRSVVRGINVVVRSSRISLVDSVEAAARDVAPFVVTSLARPRIPAEFLQVIAEVRGSFSQSHPRRPSIM